MGSTYHMGEYIREGPDALRRTLEANQREVQSLARELDGRLRRIVLTGVGSSYTAAMMALPVFHAGCPLPTYVMPGPELAHYAQSWLGPETLVVAVSRSGERGVVVEMVREAALREASTLAVTAVADSLMARACARVLLSREGPELTWPKTKSVLSATGLLMQLGLATAKDVKPEAGRLTKALEAAPSAITRTIETVEPGLLACLPQLLRHELAVVVGTGGNYGVAIEGAMKLMEASGLPTRFDTTDGLVNGPVGGLDSRWLVIALVTRVDVEETRKLVSVADELGAQVLCIGPSSVELGGQCMYRLALPEEPEPLLEALLYLPPLQLLAYHWAVERGLDPDNPAAKDVILRAILPVGREEAASTELGPKRV